MRILLISASPRMRRSRTAALAGKVIQGCVAAGAQCEVLHLHDYRIGFCRHCEICHRKILSCPIKDDAMMIARKILDADGIIFASPNYINQVAGALKTLMDRHSHFIHCKRLLGKYTAAVVTSGSGYDIPVLRYFKYYSITCGAQFSGGISCRADSWENSSGAAIALGNKLVSDIIKRKVYTSQAARIKKGIGYFAKVIGARRSDWNQEFEYWKEKGWL